MNDFTNIWVYPVLVLAVWWNMFQVLSNPAKQWAINCLETIYLGIRPN